MLVNESRRSPIGILVRIFCASRDASQCASRKKYTSWPNYLILCAHCFPSPQKWLLFASSTVRAFLTIGIPALGNMFPPFTSTVAFLQVASVAAITLNSTFLILPDVGPSNPKNLSTPFDWRCNGADYGYDLSLESCADALSQIDSSDRAMETYGLRNPDGTGHADVNWPQRFISCE